MNTILLVVIALLLVNLGVSVACLVKNKKNERYEEGEFNFMKNYGRGEFDAGGFGVGVFYEQPQIQSDMRGAA